MTAPLPAPMPAFARFLRVELDNCAGIRIHADGVGLDADTLPLTGSTAP